MIIDKNTSKCICDNSQLYITSINNSSQCIKCDYGIDTYVLTDDQEDQRCKCIKSNMYWNDSENACKCKVEYNGECLSCIDLETNMTLDFKSKVIKDTSSNNLIIEFSCDCNKAYSDHFIYDPINNICICDYNYSLNKYNSRCLSCLEDGFFINYNLNNRKCLCSRNMTWIDYPTFSRCECLSNQILDSNGICMTCELGLSPIDKSKCLCDQSRQYNILSNSCECIVSDLNKECIDCLSTTMYPFLSGYNNNNCNCKNLNKHFDKVSKQCLCPTGYVSIYNNVIDTCINCNEVPGSNGLVSSDNSSCECQNDKTFIYDSITLTYICSCLENQIKDIKNNCITCRFGLENSNSCYCPVSQGLIWINNDCVCKDSNYFYNTITKKCESCLNYKGSTGVLIDSQCECKENLLWNKDFNACTCINANQVYIIMNDQVICTTCPYKNPYSIDVIIEHPMKCACELPFIMNNNICTCSNNTVLVNNKCLNCPAKSVYSNNNCLCESSYIYDTEKNLCIKCNINQISLNNICTNCNVNQYAMDNKCISCPENSIVSLNFDTCICSADKQTNNIAYYNGNKCNYCNFREIYLNDTCLPCNNQQIQLNNQCVSCPSNSTIVTTNNTCVCDLHNIFNIKTLTCQECKSNQIPIDNNCINCPLYQIASIENDLEKCSYCRGSRILVDNYKDISINDTICVPCSLGMIGNYASNLCIPCPSNQISVFESNICISCMDFKKYSIIRKETNTCEYCRDNLLFKNPDLLSSSYSEGTCVECEIKNSIVDKESNKCIECPFGKIVNPESNSCVSCPVGTIQVNSKCVLCNICTEADQDSKSSTYNTCVKSSRYCYNNHLYDKCPSGTISNDSKECITCESLNKLKIYEKNGECVSDCGITYYIDASNNTCISCSKKQLDNVLFDKMCGKINCLDENQNYYYNYLCYSQCPKGSGYIQVRSINTENTIIDCINCRDVGKVLFKDLCIDLCPMNYIIKNGTLVDECVINNCENKICYNESSCELDYIGNPQCLCKDNYLPPDCSYLYINDKTEILNLVNSLIADKKKNYDILKNVINNISNNFISAIEALYPSLNTYINQELIISNDNYNITSLLDRLSLYDFAIEFNIKVNSYLDKSKSRYLLSLPTLPDLSILVNNLLDMIYKYSIILITDIHNTTPSNYLISKDNFYYQLYNFSSIDEFNQLSFTYKLSYIDYSNCEYDNIKSYTFLTIGVSEKISRLISNSDPLTAIQLFSYVFDSRSIKEVKLTCKRLQIYYYFNSILSLLDYNKYSSFYDQGINIYSNITNDVNDKCYSLKNTTKSYLSDIVDQRELMYDKTTFICSKGCNFDYLTEKKQIICNCDNYSKTNSFCFSYERNTETHESNELSNTLYVLTCAYKVFTSQSISNNVGFYTLFIIILCNITSIIVFLIIFKYIIDKKDFKKYREDCSIFSKKLISYSDFLHYYETIFMNLSKEEKEKEKTTQDHNEPLNKKVSFKNNGVFAEALSRLRQLHYPDKEEEINYQQLPNTLRGDSNKDNMLYDRQPPNKKDTKFLSKNRLSYKDITTKLIFTEESVEKHKNLFKKMKISQVRGNRFVGHVKHNSQSAHLYDKIFNKNKIETKKFEIYSKEDKSYKKEKSVFYYYKLVNNDLDNLNNQDLSNLSYLERRLLDSSSYVCFIYCFLMNKELITKMLFKYSIFTNQYIYYTKVFLCLSLLFLINSLFFTENDLNAINLNEDDSLFAFVLKNQILKILLSLFLSILCIKLISFVFLRLSRRNKSIINEYYLSSRIDNIKAINCYISKKVSIGNQFFIILSFILMFFSWYYITCFCGVFQSTFIALVFCVVIDIILYFLLYVVLYSSVLFGLRELGRKYIIVARVYIFLIE